MNKKINDIFDLADEEYDPRNEEPMTPSVEVSEVDLESANHAAMLREIEHKILMDMDHADKMDVVFNETLQRSRDLMDLAFDAEPRSQRGLFEVATAMYGNAINAKNSKRSMQIDILKHITTQQKLEHEKDKTKKLKGPEAPVAGEITDNKKGELLDRNALLKEVEKSK